MTHRTDWHEKCIEGYNDLQNRKAQYGPERAKPVTSAHKIYRLIRVDDIEKAEGKPKFKIFNDRKFSVEIEGPGLPELNIAEIIEKSSGKFVGAVEIPISLYAEQEFEICHDPYKCINHRGEEIEQSPNHGQIFCTKVPMKCREIKEACNWNPRPDQKYFEQG